MGFTLKIRIHQDVLDKDSRQTSLYLISGLSSFRKLLGLGLVTTLGGSITLVVQGVFAFGLWTVLTRPTDISVLSVISSHGSDAAASTSPSSQFFPKLLSYYSFCPCWATFAFSADLR
ncbi:hypothetical protein GALMADRAFT_257399 [Galerina marginata CBS 339.88]|uniref:Uncharacterized protein n=1 Tax=Galerina marginata (strain CBS 339.88) TaxID=685588 RepID=A0A067SB71_GALM3|nr:hypothetical protein GALMADRAFT_257399 [Galerina marginata CBS 339.88]